MFASCCTATSSVPARDPADKTLDLIKYRTLGVPAVDDVLDPALNMLNTAIRVNNTLVQTVDTLKLVGSTLMGAFESAVDINDATVTLLILTQDAKGNRLPVAEIKGADVTEVKKPEDYKRVAAGGTALIAIEDAASALSKLNDGLKEGRFTVAAEGGRLTLKASEDATAKQMTEYTNTVTGFNNTYFKVRLQLVQMALADCLKQAVREMIANVKALLKGAFKPSLSVDFSKLMEGELDIKPELGLSLKALKNLTKTIPAKVKACLDALFGASFLKDGNPLGKGGLIATLIATGKECAALMSKFNETKDSITSLVSNPSAIITQAKDAGLDAMSAMKLPAKVSTNVKNASKTPLVLADLFKTLKEVACEVQAGFSGEDVPAAAPATPAAATKGGAAKGKKSPPGKKPPAKKARKEEEAEEAEEGGEEGGEGGEEDASDGGEEGAEGEEA